VSALAKLGISACLLGENVRYDGGLKLNRCIIETLGLHFSFVPVCPEVECGMPTPREAMRLEGDQADPRLIVLNSRADKTLQMTDFSKVKVKELERTDLCGFVFKERSPSCGLKMVPLHNGDDSEMFSVGLFANAVARRFPLMPLEEAERLSIPSIWKDFIERVVLYRREKDLLKSESPHLQA
jgi:uncharacterized protein YbbK (DUF523 family)